ncbi:hypothetical protein [Undibacterium umbellatum]|uniref:Uncharacterized protein n=1 Tax=Undibacterium umbellatum TaxID=2762300 RepID=A0ABR6Z3D8_9BURK|nr:hypothetical protein [Undibacterium umbellatum]MBC3906230.1 hypothetical protein [Undibacterium umbellatum]
MELKEARVDAENLLEALIKNQPNLIQPGPHPSAANNGKNLAEFCFTFIETYAASLVARK